MMDEPTIGSRLLRGWLFILVLTGGAAAAGAYVSESRAPAYQATSTVIVQPKDAVGKDAVDALYPLQNSGLIPTFADIASSDATLAAAGRSISRSSQLAADIDQYVVAAQVLPQSFGVSVSVQGPDPRTAAALDAAVISVARERFSVSYPSYAVTPLSLPSSAGERVSLKTPVAALVAGVVGAFVAGLLTLAVTARRVPTPSSAAAPSRAASKAYLHG